MLNVLLSFAQFEREVTGERIRDKIAAAKRKGMWIGGVPPLGYDVDNRVLVINDATATVVRRIFEGMLAIGSPTKIAVNLTADGITTKAWTTQEGQTRTGARIDKKYLHKLLRNRIYLDELSLKGKWFPGAHPPIIERELWDKVHSVLSKDSHGRGVETKIRSRTDALLRGLLYAPSGERMYPTYSRKNGRKYHYYVSKSENRFGAPGKGYDRLTALEIEAAVVAQIRTVLTSPESIASVVRYGFITAVKSAARRCASNKACFASNEKPRKRQVMSAGGHCSESPDASLPSSTAGRLLAARGSAWFCHHQGH